MGRPLEALMKDVREAITYSEDFGARQVTVQLVGGVKRRLTVRMESERDTEGEDGLKVIERLKVTICRVSEADGSTKGLVELPAPGMKLFRDPSDDPWSDHPYTWAGEVEESWPTQWVLMFARALQHGQMIDR